MNNEINEKDLENVSGGITDSLITLSKKVCKKCQYNTLGERECNVSIEQLAEYMYHHRPVTDWWYCPFLPRGLN